MKAVTRARATPSETASRIDRIADMMRRLDWVRGVSAPMLAAEWELAPATIEALAAEASRMVRREMLPEERGEVQRSVGANLVMVSNLLTEAAIQAAEDGKHETLAKLGSAGASVGDKATMILGERAPEKHEHAHVVASYEAMPRDQKARWLREKAAQLIAEADRLEGVVPALPT